MRYYTADLHLCHPFVAAVRGFYKPDSKLTDGQVRLKNDICDEVKSGRCDLNTVIKLVGASKFADLVDVRRHDDLVIERINASVGKTDELIIAGDISTGGIGRLADALGRLDELHVPSARRTLLCGNHESFRMRGTSAEMLSKRFACVAETSYTMLGGKFPTVISHVPSLQRLTAGPGGIAPSKAIYKHAPDIPPDSGICHLHGHTHAARPDEFGSAFDVNIGMDAWDMRPVSEETLVHHIEESTQGVPWARRKRTRCGS